MSNFTHKGTRNRIIKEVQSEHRRNNSYQVRNNQNRAKKYKRSMKNRADFLKKIKN